MDQNRLTVAAYASLVEKDKERTEEIQDIIERIPTRFGNVISGIVAGTTLLLLAFGWLIRFPDIVKGQVVMNASISPIKLMAAGSGPLLLHNISTEMDVKRGQVIASIENPTSYESLLMVKDCLSRFKPGIKANLEIAKRLPNQVALGELTASYYTFVENLSQSNEFFTNNLYDKQIESLHSLLQEQVKEVVNSEERIKLSDRVMAKSRKFFDRDSILFGQKVASEAEYDRTQMDYLSSQNSRTNAISSKIVSNKEAKQTESQIAQAYIEKQEKEKELEISLLASYNDLQDKIRAWEQRYLFIAPFDGKVQFLKFWTPHQYINAGDPAFTVIPDADMPYGQVILPAYGAGKVKVGQEVIVKLDDYPYAEYGSVSGKVLSISSTTNTQRTADGDIETYLITLSFPEGLKTNYGSMLTFRHESRGTAEIITKDRKLIERLFDNLKYVLNN